MEIGATLEDSARKVSLFAEKICKRAKVKMQVTNLN